jgi:O-acetyl-ADP-ribose deacetylase (regulator of RNase III)
MGKGIALQFKQAFPENFQQYKTACQAKEVQPGRMFSVPTGKLFNPKYIINFLTNRHWREKSKIADIQTGLKALVAEVPHLGITSIAIPALGCRNSMLDWLEVKPRIGSAFVELPEVKAIIFEPITS